MGSWDYSNVAVWAKQENVEQIRKILGYFGFSEEALVSCDAKIGYFGGECDYPDVYVNTGDWNARQLCESSTLLDSIFKYHDEDAYELGYRPPKSAYDLGYRSKSWSTYGEKFLFRLFNELFSGVSIRWEHSEGSTNDGFHWERYWKYNADTMMREHDEYLVTDAECAEEDLEPAYSPITDSKIHKDELKYIQCLIELAAADGNAELTAMLLELTNRINEPLEIVIPDGTESIEARQFWGDEYDRITSVIIPESVHKIGSAAFKDCISLKSIKIPSGVTAIGEHAFEFCGLTSVEIPSSVTAIGESAFCSCHHLTSIAIPSSVTSIGESAFRRCHDLTSVEIPSSVTAIGKYAFCGCGLTSVEIPNSAVKIGDWAFHECEHLTSIKIASSVVEPSSVTEIGRSAFSPCSYTSSACSSLTSIEIRSGTVKIGEVAFEGCSSLTSIEIQGDAVEIGERAFQGCAGLESVVLPEGTTHLPAFAFKSCSALTTVTLPGSLVSIEKNTFRECPNLKTAIITEALARNEEVLLALPSKLKFKIGPDDPKPKTRKKLLDDIEKSKG